MRAKVGCDVHPTGLEILERVGRFCKEKFLKDSKFDNVKFWTSERPLQVIDDFDEADNILDSFGVKPAILKCLFQLPARSVIKNLLEAIVL
jgi:hypothetical protein